MSDRDPLKVFAPKLLAGRTALVTGGATGIGFGIAKTLGRLGAAIAIMSRKEENLVQAVASLKEFKIDCSYEVADVREATAIEAAVASIASRHGSLDILVNNAAGLFHCPAEELSPNGWRTLVDIDLNGTFFCCHAAFKYLKDSKFGGRIVNIVSPYAWTSWPGAANATAAKAGIIALAHTLAIEWARFGIRLNNVAPGPIAGTGGIERMAEDPERRKRELEHVALGEFGEIDDIANAVAYLASPAGTYVTGADLLVDGGRQFNFVPAKLARLRKM
jgi:NAD(P)-dependent dehydrogenase (short-subunit alcohol dehydrogenase family)